MKLLVNEEAGRVYRQGDGFSETRPDTLLIGYGNPLRGTDRVGREIVEEAVAHFGPRLKAIASHQLNPEMAALFVAMRTAVFVDADRGPDRLVRVRRIPAASGRCSLPGCGPAELLALAAHLHQARPEAWLIAVPAGDFEWCGTLSLVAREAKARALEEIGRILRLAA